MIKSLIKHTFIASASIALLAQANTNDLPFGASLDFPKTNDTGACYSKITVPAVVEKKTEKVLVKPASKSYATKPATFKTVNKTITVRDASKKIVPVPAKFKTVTEKVMTQEASEKHVYVPAKFKTVTEKVLVTPATKKWKTGNQFKAGAISTKKGADGETRCLVEVPAVYKTITKKVIDTPATTKVVKIPAKFTTVTKRVIATPATTKSVDVPAITKVVPVKEMLSPESTIEKEIPAEYRTITKEVLVSQGRDEWHRILCQRNTNKDTVKSLQRKLTQLGFYKGPIDGVHGGMTSKAVNRYQVKKMNSKNYRGKITWATLKSLEIDAAL